MSPVRKVSAVRLANFEYLLQKYADEHRGRSGGILRRLAQEERFLEAGLSENVLSQIKTQARGIGPVTARKIEQAFDQPDGWLDLAHDEFAPRNIHERHAQRKLLKGLRALKSDEEVVEMLERFDRWIRDNVPDDEGDA